MAGVETRVAGAQAPGETAAVNRVAVAQTPEERDPSARCPVAGGEPGGEPGGAGPGGGGSGTRCLGVASTVPPASLGRDTTG